MTCVNASNASSHGPGILRRFWGHPIPVRLRLKLYWMRRGFQTLSLFGGIGFAAATIVAMKRCVEVSVPGYQTRLWVRPNTSDIVVLHQVFIDKCYDLPELKTAGLIIDGGANAGYASVWFALRYPDARIVAVEPEPSNFELLERNTRHLTGIHAMHAAIWSQRCQLAIANPSEEKWEFRIVTAAGFSDSIDAVTIPDLLQWAVTNRIDLLKLDVEGAEREIFAADSAWLQRTHYLIIELHDYLIPGCGDAFRKAISKFSFERLTRGEHEIFSNNDPIFRKVIGEHGATLSKAN